ncbi:glycosyltransferase family 39 protein [Candidatus Woesebacteria bacterium]|nr:glycosyltransferase family 39 protein [Candidatus Woesebacteria bacterium]
MELIGPPVSFIIDGRQIFHSSITYYFSLLFLLPAHFSPAVSSYLFTLFATLSLIPLYLSVKTFVNKNSAIFMTIIYSLLPFYIDYSRFLWNPNFQFILTPYLFYILALYKKYKSKILLFCVGLGSGILLLFHYQYIVIIVVLFFYIMKAEKNLKRSLIFSGGFIAGFSPLLVFELRNNFYNLQTALLFVKEMGSSKFSNNWFSPHYILSVSFFTTLAVLYFTKLNIGKKINLITFLLLLSLSIVKYFPHPESAFGSSANWNYPKEEKVYKIITTEDLDSFNVVNLIYDTKANVQKYLLTVNNTQENLKDYYHNKYLYIITDKGDPLNDPAYEVATFKPSKILKTWKIDNVHFLYLIKRQ